MTEKTIDIGALRAMEVTREPFPHMIVPSFIRSDALQAIDADFPQIDCSGSLPLPTLDYGPKFKEFIDDIQGPEMRSAIAEKFDIDLRNRPTMITVRGRCRATDGRIHNDSKTKLITVLIYMNGTWESPGGRLRLLNSPDNLNDMFAEVPPDQGTLLVFRNQSNAWHGHESFEGIRRAVQLNWVRDVGVVWREKTRHSISAFFKKLNTKVSSAA
jgi:SM-20-related protein